MESAKIDSNRSKEIGIDRSRRQAQRSTTKLISKKNEGNGKIVTARRELEIAKIEVEKYRDGDSKADEAELLRLIADGQAQLQKILDERSNIEILVKKGYRSPEQLDEYRLRVNSLTKAVERDRQKLENLKKYDFKTQIDKLSRESNRRGTQTGTGDFDCPAEVDQSRSGNRQRIQCGRAT